MARTRADLRDEIERLEGRDALRHHERIRTLRRAVDALDADEERDRSAEARRIAKLRQEQANKKRLGFR